MRTDVAGVIIALVLAFAGMLSVLPIPLPAAVLQRC